ncbi:MAG: preprotein translocase subunit SecY [Clostridia bacterium]|nr:preprotein translocase subunit SecY [Clostridia bacterium]
MLQTIKNAWKIPDLRKKIIFTLLMIIIFRFGSVIPVPFLSSEAISQFLDSMGEDSLLNMLNTFSGNAFSNATIFAMSITPYINASIIMQLLTVAIPALERMSKEGMEGRKKIAQWSRYVTIVLGLIQAWGLYMALRNSVTVPAGIPKWLVATTVILTFTAGTAFLMWLGEQINDKGIGNGISIIIFAGIVSRGPQLVLAIKSYLEMGKLNWISTIVLIVVALAVVSLIVMMNDAERRIPVQYSKRVVGRKMYGGQSTHIPIKVASAGVMPIIFAMSIMAFPSTVAGFFGKTASNTSNVVGKFFLTIMSSSHWFYGIFYFLLILFFTYFYKAIQYNPIEMANSMKKNGGFIPGIRPGKATSDFINKSMSKITLAGAIFLGLIAVLPIFMSQVAGISISIGGTSLLIVVGVALETVKQMESQMVMRHYKGFLE